MFYDLNVIIGIRPFMYIPAHKSVPQRKGYIHGVPLVASIIQNVVLFSLQSSLLTQIPHNIPQDLCTHDTLSRLWPFLDVFPHCADNMSIRMTTQKKIKLLIYQRVHS